MVSEPLTFVLDRVCLQASGADTRRSWINLGILSVIEVLDLELRPWY